MSSAVSLSDAWNDPPPNVHEPKMVSARQVEISSAEPEISEPSPKEQLYDALLEELRFMRSEETRRCTVYLIVVGVLFAMLYAYIDKLNRQVKLLNEALIHNFLPNPRMRGIPKAPHTLNESPSLWYS